MNLREKLENTLHDAMRSGNTTAKNTIRMALTNIKLAEVQKGAKLDDPEIVNILQKEIKSRKETIADAEKAHRQDIIDSTQQEIMVIEPFLPKQLTDDELKILISQVIAEINAQSMTDMGKVMKTALPKVQGQASNEAVSRITRELLNK